MRRLLILAVLVCGTVCAYAGITNSGPVEFTFINWSGGNWENGYPYYISPTDNPNQVIAVMCDDYAHGGQPGDEWMANITDLGTGNISLTRFNNLVGAFALYPLMLYNEAGWILTQTLVEPTSAWQQMNYAVWTIFDPSAPCDSTCQAWIAAAETNIKGLPQSYFDDVYIVTPVNQHDPNDNDIQEFMYLGESSSSDPSNQTTPEPGTFLLMGTGLVAVFRRKLFS
jgi:PEP-CTERM motif